MVIFFCNVLNFCKLKVNFLKIHNHFYFFNLKLCRLLLNYVAINMSLIVKNNKNIINC